MKKSISNKRLVKLGKTLRNDFLTDSIDEESITLLQEYRVSFKKPLSDVFKILLDLRKNVSKEVIVTYRIKRLDTIINKLARFKTMKLSGMWDIGGCRIILNNNDEVEQFRNEIEKVLCIKKTNDYIKNPKVDGYKSLHLYVEDPGKTKTIEIQLRSKQDHSWATLVEITDLLFDAKLKEHSHNKELLEFHLLLSNIKSLTLLEVKRIAKTIKKYGYIDKLNSVFSRNYLPVRARWFMIENEDINKYFLIETTKNKIPIIDAFSNFNLAEKKYFEKFEKNTNANLVLTHLPKARYEQMSIAYSNYVLTMHSFMELFSGFYEELIIDSLKNNKLLNFRSYFDAHYNLTTQLLINSIKEIIFSEKVFGKISTNERQRLQKKEKEWKREIEKKIQLRIKNSNKFKRNYKNYIASKGINKYITELFVKLIIKKYDRKLKRSLK